MFNPEETNPYSVHADGAQYQIVDWEGQVILVCNDAGSAEQYAALMNQTFRRGYKAGFRSGRKTGRESGS